MGQGHSEIRAQYDRITNEMESLARSIKSDIEIIFRRNKALAKYLFFKACALGMIHQLIPELLEMPEIGAFFNRENKARRGKRLIVSKVYIQNLLDLSERQARVYHKGFEVEAAIDDWFYIAQRWMLYARSFETSYTEDTTRRRHEG